MDTGGNQQDPYFIVKEEVQKSLQHLQQLFETWQRLDATRRSGATSFSQDQLKWTADEIKASINTIKWDIDDLEEANKIAEQNQQKFRLDAAEVQRRKQFVGQARQKIDNIQKALSGQASTNAPSATTTSTLIPSPGTLNNIQQQQQQQKKSPSATMNTLGGPGRSNTDPLRQQPVQIRDVHRADEEHPRPDNLGTFEIHQQQQMIMQDQDEALDNVYSTVVNMKNIAATMNDELDGQARLLDQLDRKTDTTQNRLRTAQQRLNKFIKDNAADSKSQWCIIGLTIVVVILIFLVLFL